MSISGMATDKYVFYPTITTDGSLLMIEHGAPGVTVGDLGVTDDVKDVDEAPGLVDTQQPV